MNISDEAVEAAAKALTEVDPLWPDGAWETMPDELREQARGMVSAIIEAAAPYLLAQGWDEGVAYVFEGGAEVHDENPYRGQA